MLLIQAGLSWRDSVVKLWCRFVSMLDPEPVVVEWLPLVVFTVCSEEFLYLPCIWKTVLLTVLLLIRGGKPDDPTWCISWNRLQTAHSHHGDHPHCQWAPSEGADAPHDLPATYTGRSPVWIFFKLGGCLCVCVCGLGGVVIFCYSWPLFSVRNYATTPFTYRLCYSLVPNHDLW